MKINVRFYHISLISSYIMRNVSDKFAYKIKTHFMFKNFFSSKILHCMR
jgi:hypothetical protein